MIHAVNLNDKSTETLEAALFTYNRKTQMLHWEGEDGKQAQLVERRPPLPPKKEQPKGGPAGRRERPPWAPEPAAKMSLVATGLIKRYGPRQVVAGVNLQVEPRRNHRPARAR